MSKTNEKALSNPRSRKWTGASSYYYDTHDTDGNLTSTISVEDWEQGKREEFQKLVDDGKLLVVTYVRHDKDIDKDGNPANVHLQIFAESATSITESQARSYLGIPPKTTARDSNCSYVRSLPEVLQYLPHIGSKPINDGKYVYGLEAVQIITADPQKYNMQWYRENIVLKKDTEAKQKKDAREQIFSDVLKGAVSLSQAREEYLQNKSLGAVAFAEDKTKLTTLREEYKKQVADFYDDPQNGYCKTTTLISGAGGLGKTTLADYVGMQFAGVDGIHRPAPQASGITYDPAGTYDGQRVTIMNEIEGQHFGLESFCGCFDPTSAGYMSSRNKDKYFYPERIFLTTSDDLLTMTLKIFDKYAEGRNNSLGLADKERRILLDVLKGNNVNAYEYGDKHTADFLLHALTDGADAEFGTPYSAILDKLWQVRRRIAVYIRLQEANDGSRFAGFYYCDYSHKTLSLRDNICTGNAGDMYVPVLSMQYNTDDENSLKELLDAYNRTVKTYYEANGFSRNPDTLKRPEF